jgi:hypothetical protein
MPLSLSSRWQGLFCEVELCDEVVDLAGDVALDAVRGHARGTDAMAQLHCLIGRQAERAQPLASQLGDRPTVS